MEPWYKVVTPHKEVREGRSFDPSEFVKTNLLPVRLSDWIHQAHRARMRGDYDPAGPMSEAESKT